MKSVEKGGGGVTVAHNLLLPLEGRAGRTATVGCKGTRHKINHLHYHGLDTAIQQGLHQAVETEVLGYT